MTEKTVSSFVTIPCAHSVSIYWCGDEECGYPHVILHDSEGKPYAQFLPPEGFGAKLAHADDYAKELRAEAVKSAARPALALVRNEEKSDG
jgi:hypothetical protein